MKKLICVFLVVLSLFSACTTSEEPSSSPESISSESTPVLEEPKESFPVHTEPTDSFVGTWYRSTERNDGTMEEWFWIHDDNTFLHLMTDPKRYTEGVWRFEESRNWIQLAPKTQYVQFGDNPISYVTIDPPDTYEFGYWYTLEIPDSNEDFLFWSVNNVHYMKIDDDTEKENFYQEKLKYQDPAPFEEILPRLWHPSPDVGGVCNDRYLLFEDGVFVFSENQAATSVRRRYSTGKWWLEGQSTLCFSATHEIRIEGGTVKDGGLFGEYIDGGKLVEREIPEAERGVTRYPIYLLPYFLQDHESIVHFQMGEYELWTFGGVDVSDMLRFCYTYYYPEQLKDWFAGYSGSPFYKYVEEEWQQTNDVEWLDLFFENYKDGHSDEMLVLQHGNPGFHQYLISYDGRGKHYTVQEFPSKPKDYYNITLIDDYYYFTEGEITVEDGIITYERDGEMVVVEFNTFPKAEDQPLKIGRNGSGWQHP